MVTPSNISMPSILFLFFYFFETKGQHASVKAQEAIDHLASFFIA
jgi:hypothetical protein